MGAFRLLLQDDGTNFKIGRRNMGNHTAGESCYQAFMEIFQIARCTVTCRNDVVIIVSNRVKSVENFHTG